MHAHTAPVRTAQDAQHSDGLWHRVQTSSEEQLKAEGSHGDGTASA